MIATQQAQSTETTNITVDTPAEQQLHLLAQALEQTGHGVLIADNAGTIQYVNRQFCDCTGYERGELIGNNPRMLQSGSTSRETYLQLWNTVSSGEPWQGELQNQRKNGDFYWERITISPIVSPRQEITHYVAVVEDITEEKLLHESLQRLDQQSYQEQKRHSLENLSRQMVGDFNNVLTAVLGNAFLALGSTTNRHECEQRLKRIIKAGHRGAELCGQFLDLTGLRGLLVEEERDVVEITDQLIDELESASVELRIEHQQPSLIVSGDSLRITQAVRELIFNAQQAYGDVTPQVIAITTGVAQVDHTESPDLFIDFSSSRGEFVFVEVSDLADGMDSETLSQAFDPFFTTKPDARGVGLAKVLGVVHDHSGAISVHTARTEGTRVRIFFPVLDAS